MYISQGKSLSFGRRDEMFEYSCSPSPITEPRVYPSILYIKERKKGLIPFIYFGHMGIFLGEYRHMKPQLLSKESQTNQHPMKKSNLSNQ